MTQDRTQSSDRAALNGELLELLQVQFACKGKSSEWRPAVARLFLAAIAPLPASIAREIVVRVILASPYLPTASDVWQRAIDAASPTMPDYEAWALAETFMGRTWPPGVPSLVRAAVRDVGGLDGIWHRYHWMREQLGSIRRDFIDAYAGRVKEHREAITAQLLMPAEQRDPSLFPAGSPFVAQRQLTAARNEVGSGPEKVRPSATAPDRNPASPTGAPPPMEDLRAALKGGGR